MKRLSARSSVLLAAAALLGHLVPGPTTLGAERSAPPGYGVVAPEVEIGGFILYQPFNGEEGQLAADPYTSDGKTYSATTVRWAPVGFLRVEEDENLGKLVEHWFLSKGDTASSVTGSHVTFVEKYYWPGRSTPLADKHVDYKDLPVRFERRNDLSGAVDLDEFIAEVGTEYGFALAPTANKFERIDLTTP